MSALASHVVVNGLQARPAPGKQPLQPFTSHALLVRNVMKRQQLVCRAEPEQEPKSEGQAPTPSPPMEKSANSELAKGQGTAIVTGAISIIFGILYLALVSFMDFRGGEMLPPPPEAYGP